MHNLIDNANRYSPPNWEIDVEVTVRDSVSDRGVGIPKEKQPLIFQRFNRPHTGTPHDYGGTRVGLYISREIVAQHSGRMCSRARRAGAALLALPSRPSVAVAGNWRGTILVVADERQILDLAGIVLAEESYQVLIVPNGQAGLDAVEREMPDLILLDMKMPAKDACQFAGEFHARYDHSTPVVVLTATQTYARVKSTCPGRERPWCESISLLSSAGLTLASL